MVAHQLLSKVVDEFLAKYPRTAFTTATPPLAFPELKEYIVKYQDPQQADSIMKIQKELDETKIVLHKTIESVLERGEKIDTLVQKSDGLSAQSKMFYTQVCSICSTEATTTDKGLHASGKEAELLLCGHVTLILYGIPLAYVTRLLFVQFWLPATQRGSRASVNYGDLQILVG